jgi:hypothetical protein
MGDKIIKKRFPRKKLFGLLIGFSLIYIPIVNSGFNNSYDEKIDVANIEINSDIQILDITDGIGLNIIIKNNGDSGIENLILVVDTNDKTLIMLKKQYEISYISAGDTTNIHLNVFGFNIGLIRDFTKISFILKDKESIIIESQIIANIIGPYVEIISKYFDIDGDIDGYILFCPMWSTTTYLINKGGRIVHTWENSIYQDSQSTYLMENGNLVRASLVAASSFTAGGYQGRVEIFDWNDTRVWNYEYSTFNYCSHHDVQPLPNGNILLIAWERIHREEAINSGRKPNNIQGDYLWSDYIIEVQPLGDNDGLIVWEWHAWDHLIQDYDNKKENYGIVEEHPELIDINFGSTRTDWLHTNSIDYNPELDQILLSIHNFNEIWIIDHSTTVEEASSHSGGKSGKGGDILYRWGNPRSYRAGNANDQKYFGQHGATWVKTGYPDDGNIIVFNNGAGRSERYSTVDEIIPPIDEYGNYEYIENQSYKPKKQNWIYSTNNPQDMYSTITSNVLRLPNENTLICASNQGYFLEVTKGKNIVWEYKNPYPIGFFNKGVARIQWYSDDYPGLRFLTN